LTVPPLDDRVDEFERQPVRLDQRDVFDERTRRHRGFRRSRVGVVRQGRMVLRER
jgi:hypothetical protein